MKIYIASPFFCDWDVLVRNKMVEAMKSFDLSKLNKFNTERKINRSYKAHFFRPDHTLVSKLYSLFHSDYLAKKIYKDDFENLKDSDVIVFPEYTSDLGTLFEIGCAIGLNKCILRYNYLTNSITELTDVWDYRGKIVYNYMYALFQKDELVIDCSKPTMAISCGVLVSQKMFNFKYSLPPTWADNIMFKYSGIKRKLEDGIKYNQRVL